MSAQYRPPHLCPPFVFEVLEGSERRREVRLRTGLAKFLNTMSEHFSLAVWTAAPLVYAQQIVDGIDKVVPHFKEQLVCVMTEEEVDVAWRGRPIVTKPLAKLAATVGVPLWRCLIVDDTPSTYADNPANALPVPSFKGAPDDVLPLLGAFLVQISTAAGVAPLDVQGWMYAPKYGVHALHPPASLDTQAQSQAPAPDLKEAAGEDLSPAVESKPASEPGLQGGAVQAGDEEVDEYDLC